MTSTTSILLICLSLSMGVTEVAAQEASAETGAEEILAGPAPSGPEADTEPDADAVQAELELPPEPSAAITQTPRQAAYERMERMLEEERYAEAREAAEAVVRLTEDAYGPDSMELAAPLDNLATTQMLDGDLIEAAGNYQRSIAIIKQAEGMLTPRLVNPYVGLGATYNRAGLYEQAEEAFATALRINHVNEGFYNLDQIRIRDGLTESFIGLDDFEEANFHQTIQLEISQRRHGEESPATAPAMYKLARWYERAGLLEEARYTYQRAQQIVRRAEGKNSPAIVPSLEGLASTYERQGLLAESASRLKKALKIIESQPEIDRPKQAELLVRLGDLFLTSGRADTANANYERGWQSLAEEPPREDLLELYFDTPVRVAGLGWRTLRYGPGVRGDAPDLLDGYVLVRYDVKTNGRPDDVRIVEADPPELMDDRVKSAVRRSYFRPRYSEGVAVRAEDLFYRHDFRYRRDPTGKSKDAGKPLEPPPETNRGGRLELPDADDT